ncbi:VOC family protein [Fulvivirgaceae bacterium PWU37]|uniref:VOC family protein n=2 Tax=Dawidia soli TaxID=2782352 RepID=A0AAP2DD42_9BACT|nr:VOC family protein [Dawidia soli]
MESVSPNIYVYDIDATVAFYKQLGFEVAGTVPDHAGGLTFVMMTCGAVTFMFQTFHSIDGQLPIVRRENGGSLLLYIKMKGIRAYYERIKDIATVVTPLEKTFYGATEFSIEDNNQYLLTFAEDE